MVIYYDRSCALDYSENCQANYVTNNFYHVHVHDLLKSVARTPYGSSNHFLLFGGLDCGIDKGVLHDVEWAWGEASQVLYMYTYSLGAN